MRQPLCATFGLCCGLSLPLAAEIAIPELPALAVFGDTTLRYEREYDEATGRPDRTRVRITQHLGLVYTAESDWEARVRARTGEHSNQHTPTVTIWAPDDNPYGQRGVYLDVYQLAGSRGRFAWTAGRQEFPFWANTDYFWDTDVTPLGVSAQLGGGEKDPRWQLNLGSYTTPDGLRGFQGYLFSAQVQHRRPWARGTLRAAQALHLFPAETGARFLKEAFTDRDYLISVTSLRWETRWQDWPVALGADALVNILEADVPQASERWGLGLVASLGENRKPGDWRFVYAYAHIERFAVHPEFAQDTISRFDTSNLRGHDLRAIYSLATELTIMARLSLTEAIIGPAEGFRFRIDIDYAF